MHEQDTAQPLIRFVIRIAQEFTVDATHVGEAYAEMHRLAQRPDERAKLVDGRGYLCPASDTDAALLSQESPNT